MCSLEELSKSLDIQCDKNSSVFVKIGEDSQLHPISHLTVSKDTTVSFKDGEKDVENWTIILNIKEQ